jgi:hypothetical protein
MANEREGAGAGLPRSARQSSTFEVRFATLSSMVWKTRVPSFITPEVA